MDTIFWVLIVAFAVFHIVVMVVVLRAGLAVMDFLDGETRRRMEAERLELQRIGTRR